MEQNWDHEMGVATYLYIMGMHNNCSVTSWSFSLSVRELGKLRDVIV